MTSSRATLAAFALCSCAPKAGADMDTGGDTDAADDGAETVGPMTSDDGIDGGDAPADDDGVDDGGSSSGGPDPVPQPMVADCDALAGVDEFENITPPDVDLAVSELGIVHLLVDPVNVGTIYAGTDHQGLYRSDDCGAAWHKVSTGTNSDVLEAGTLWSMAIDPTMPEVMYGGSLYSSNSGLFKSTNAGVDWTALFPRGSEVATHVEYTFFQDLSLEAGDPQHIVVTFHAPCLAPYPANCLGESLDGGDTWRLFGGPFESWGEGAWPYAIGPTSYLVGAPQGGLYLSEDAGETWMQVGPGGSNNPYHGTDGTWYIGSDFGLLRSDDLKVWTSVEGGPQAFAIEGDGTRLFAGVRYSDALGGQPYFTAPEDAGTPWTPLPSPDMSESGPVTLEYEAHHHLLYSVNVGSGLWRMVTQ